MDYRAGVFLPEYRVRASIETADPRNQISRDEYAWRYGFRSAVVPGISLFAYMSRSLVEFLNRQWLERGSAEVRFLHPIYHGEEIRVSGMVSALSQNGLISMDLQAVNNQGTICGIGIAQLPREIPVPEPTVSDYPAGPQKLRRPISLESLQVGERLTPITSEFTWKVHWQYCQKSIRDHHVLYQSILHPGWITGRASEILVVNYDIPAWIDVACRVQNFHVLEEECLIETRGRVYSKFEVGGDHFIVLDLGVFARSRCLQSILYTAIFHIAPSAA